jgi:hypothetical protein
MGLLFFKIPSFWDEELGFQGFFNPRSEKQRSGQQTLASQKI